MDHIDGDFRDDAWADINARMRRRTLRAETVKAILYVALACGIVAVGLIIAQALGH